MIELPSFDHIQDPNARALLELMKSMLENQQAINEQLLEANRQLSADLKELKRLFLNRKSEKLPTGKKRSKKKPKQDPAQTQKKR